MLLTIHNLPATTRYADIKSLLQSKCGLQHVILDNLVTDGNGKKVTVGVAEDADAAILVRKINGLYWNGQQLYVEDVRQQKTASEQPFRATNPQLQETSDQSFRSMNMQQHSSFSNKMGMPSNLMTPAVHPMMAAMYYVPDYTNQEYMQPVNMQGNFIQEQGYDQVTQKVQNTYMGIGGFSQTATQMSQVGMVPQFNKDSQPGNQSSRWGESYDKEEDFGAERPHFGRRSPENNIKTNWFSNQQRRRESPPRERSTERDQSWQPPRGFDTRAPRPTQPDFRPSRPDDRSGFKKPRLDFRPNDRSPLLENPVRPEFGSHVTGQNQFSGRPNAFSGRPNQRQERPNDRETREFGRPNERQGHNEFSGRPNERQGHEFSGRPNERQGRPNEFSDRKGRPNDRPGFSRPNDRPEFDRSNEREEFNRLKVRDEPVRSNDRFELSRRGPNQRDVRPERDSRPVRGNPKSEVPDSRKRKFDEGYQQKPFERPSRVSRPNLRPRAPVPVTKRTVSNDPGMFHHQIELMNEVEKEKYSKRMFLAGVRKIIYEIKLNLSIHDPDLITRQVLNKFVNERLKGLLGGKKMVTPLDCYGVYRTMYPVSNDKAAYDEVLAMVAQKKANEALGVQPVAVVAPAPPPVPKPVVLPKKTFPPNPPLTKGERKAKKMFQEAKHLLSQGKVPSFPLGSKQIVAQQKKEDKEGYIPEVKGPYKPAVTEEVKAITDLFIKELNNAPDESVQKVYDSIDRNGLIDEITHNITQTLSRRILDSGLKVVRIYGCPKMPKREIIEKFLLKFGVQSLRKSVKSKMYTAALDTYKNYDRLCAKQSVIVSDGNTLSFKPFHVAPKPKADQKVLRVMRKKILRDMVDKNLFSLLDENWPAKEAEIKQKEEEEAAKALEKQVLDAQKMAEDAEKKSIEAQKNAQEAENKSLEPQNETNEEKKIDNSENKDVSSEYLNADFHVIDEIHENDSDVEHIERNEVMLDGGNNDGETNVEGNNEENDVENFDADVSYEVENNEVKTSNNIEFTNDVDDNFDHDFEENDVELAYKEFEKIHSAAADVDIDNVDVDDVDDDDLEDY